MMASGDGAPGDQHGVKQESAILTEADERFDRRSRTECQKEREKREGTECSPDGGSKSANDVMATPSSLEDPCDQVDFGCHSTLSGSMLSLYNGNMYSQPPKGSLS